MQLIIITGLSGAGKGLAARHLEDFGFFCVDNLPPMLISSFAELLERGKIGKAALVVDVRGGEFFPELLAALEAVGKSELEARILFLDCDDDALLQRFKETRRKHPLDEGEGLGAAIERERELLVPLRERADKVINTSRVTPRELRAELERTFVGNDETPGLSIQIESFGFKHGPNASADLVFDVRFLPNPNYDREIGHLDGYCQPVIDYVMREPITGEFLARLEDFLLFLIPQFEREGKAYLTVAIGCTGGRHRSVALSNFMAQKLASHGYRVAASHRDLVRGPSVVSHAVTPQNQAQIQNFSLTDAEINVPADVETHSTILGEANFAQSSLATQDLTGAPAQITSDIKENFGDAEKKLGDAENNLGYTENNLGDAENKLGDAESEGPELNAGEAAR